MKCPFHDTDPFKESREKGPVLVNKFQGEDIPMILRHEDLRQAAKDWQKYSSDAPMRVPIPTEEEVRSVRQLPLEVDAPDHQEYRALVEPFYNRAKEPAMITAIESLIACLLEDAIRRPSIELVREFAIPLQSRALARLLNMPDSEAEIWIVWGVHVFREGDGRSKGKFLETYMNSLLDRAEKNPGNDFFSMLNRLEFRGRPLTREEKLGYGSIVFAGGRDTIIHSITGILGHLAETPRDFEFLRQDTSRITLASEEFFRAISPVTHLGRVCPVEADVHGVKVQANEHVTLCFSSANYDAKVFEDPAEIKLDRKPNPHVAFGFGPHLCLGAAHARLVIRTLMRLLCERVGAIEILEAVPKYEREEKYQRRLAYDRLEVKFISLNTDGQKI